MATFGQFSATAFFSNILVFPAVFPMMMFGCAVAAAGFASFHLSFLAAKLAEILIWYELGIIRLFSVIVVPLPQVFASAWAFIVYYAALGWFAYHHRNRTKKYFSSSLRRQGSALPVSSSGSADPRLHGSDELNENFDF
jgi:hypothetical protein